MASDLRDIVDQMAAVGIFVPAGYELKAGTIKFQRFRPADQKKNKKSAWYIIYENFTKSGKAYYSSRGLLTIGHVKSEKKQRNSQSKLKSEIKKMLASGRKRLRKPLSGCGLAAVTMCRSHSNTVSTKRLNPTAHDFCMGI